MPGFGGLSIANNVLSNAIQLHLNDNQKALQTSVTRLASGLRINSAADDPSGLAIAEKLLAQVNGFDEASLNVQNANNAAIVAEGALQATTDILQRIRTLAVEGASDITSPTDRQGLQTEVTQLLREINRIAAETQFNGIALLDGSHAGFQPEVDSSLVVTTNAALASAGLASNITLVSSANQGSTFGATTYAVTSTSSGVDLGLLIASVVGIGANTASAFNTTAGAVQGSKGAVSGAGGATGSTVDGTIELQVVNTGTSIAVQETFFVSSTGNVYQAYQLLSANSVSALFDNVQIVLGNFSTADVGMTAYIKISQNVAVNSNPNAPSLTFQSAAAEGAIIELGVASTNTAALRIGNVNLIATASATPSIAAEDAIGQVDSALQTLVTERAMLGAVIVRLNEDADNDNIASVNLQASESNIRDLNVASETTNFNRLQILVKVGTSVLTQGNLNAQNILHLFK